MQIEKDLISLEPLSFDRIKDHVTRTKELQLKLGESGKDFPKKNGQLIELVLMKSRTPYDVCCSSFCTNWMSWK